MLIVSLYTPTPYHNLRKPAWRRSAWSSCCRAPSSNHDPSADHPGHATIECHRILPELAITIETGRTAGSACWDWYNMTKRKRSPPAPQQRAFEIPASLQRLSNISRSLAKQSDDLAGTKEADKNTGIIAQAQDIANGPAPSTPAAPMSRPGPVKIGSAFRGFVERKQPSFPDTQTWVEPKPKLGVPRAPLYAGSTDDFTLNGLPAFPEEQKWVTPRPNPGTVPHNVGPTTGLVPIAQPTLPQGSSLSQTQSKKKAIQHPSVEGQRVKPKKVPRPPKGETLCMATEPDKIAALVAQKRAENEANCRREAWARKQATQSLSNEPDDQLMNELNETLDPRLRYVNPSGATLRNCLIQLEPYPSIEDAIFIDPTSPDTGEADPDHDSLCNSAPPSPTSASPSPSSSSHDSIFSSIAPSLAPSSSHDSLFSAETSSPAPEVQEHQPGTHAPTPVVNQPSTNSEANPANPEPAWVNGQHSQGFNLQPRPARRSWRMKKHPPKPRRKVATQGPGYDKADLNNWARPSNVATDLPVIKPASNHLFTVAMSKPATAHQSKASTN